MSVDPADDSEKLVQVWSKQHYLPRQVRTTLERFLKHLGKSARQVLDEQAKASRSDNPDEKYRLIDALLEWVNSLELRRSTKKHMVTVVRSFFSYFRRPLPSPERVRLQRLTDDHDEVIGKLDPDTFDALIAKIREFEPNVEPVAMIHYINLRTGYCGVQVAKQHLRIHARGKLDHPHFREWSSTTSWGKRGEGGTVTVRNQKDLDEQLMRWIRGAFEIGRHT